MNSSPIPLLIVCAALAVLDCGAAPSPTPGTAEALVVEKLAAAGLRTGRDAKTGRIVETAVASREIASVADGKLLSLRDELAMAAILDAKAKIAHRLRDEFTVEERTVTTSSGEGGEKTERITRHQAHSKHLWLGMTVIYTAESFRDGVYSVCAAVGWSPEMRTAVLAQLSAAPKAADTDVADTSPEWAAWAAKQDFATLFGPRTFVDSAGIRRYVGIGFADVEGKQGAALVSAMRLARVKASRNLLFAVFSDLEADVIISQTLTTDADGEISLDSDVRNRIVQRCKSKHLFDDEVHTLTLTHPLTGRAMFVSVAGVEPERLAEMNLLGTTP